VDLLPLLAVLPTWAAVLVYRRFRGDAAAPYGFVAAVGLPLLLASLSAYDLRRINSGRNRLGLVAGMPDHSDLFDYTNHPMKDDYPPIEVSNNSLGYRDIEPPPRDPRRERVLLIGDSYIWGDGIPTVSDTLPALLRDRLEKRAPGRFDVTSAAYPGLGTYGYRRALERMVPEVHPDLVVVGYLGSADDDPLDSQALADLLPREPWLSRIIANLRTLQDLHEGSVTTLQQDQGWSLEQGEKNRGALFQKLRELAWEQGHRALLLCYCDDPPTLSGVEVVTVPEAWRYQGHRSALWYAKDAHPKPPLNRRLAAWLADEIIDPGSAKRAEPPPRTHDDQTPPPAAANSQETQWVIPPGQEALISAMLGGTDDVQHCRLQDASVLKRIIEASYDCGGRELRPVTLHHPNEAPEVALQTKQFALTSSAPEVPRAFLDALATRIASREAEFQWNRPTGPPESSDAPALPALTAPHRIPWRLILIALAALIVTIAGWRRDPAPMGGPLKRSARTR
jgi:hypothetical protein